MKISDALVPPNPKEFDRAARIFRSRALSGTRSTPRQFSDGLVRFKVGGATWSRLGSNLPYTTAMDVHAGPDARLYVATHGRGIWSIAQP